MVHHTNHPGWLVTVRHSTTGLEVARSFGRLSTWGFGLRLHRLNPCRYTATRWLGDTLINSYGICETSGISNHFCWYFQRIQEFRNMWVLEMNSLQTFNHPMFYKYRLPKKNPTNRFDKILRKLQLPSLVKLPGSMGLTDGCAMPLARCLALAPLSTALRRLEVSCRWCPEISHLGQQSNRRT